MFEWITENGATIGITAALAVIVGLIIFKMVRDKKKGGSGCGCGCSSCAMSDKCHGDSAKQKK